MSAVEELTRMSEKVGEPEKKGGLKRSGDKSFLPPLNVVKIQDDKSRKEDGKAQKEFTEGVKKEAEEAERLFLFAKINDYFSAPGLRAKIPPHLKPPTTHASLQEMRQTWAAIKGACTFEQKKMFVDRLFLAACMGIEKGFVDFGKDESKRGLCQNYLFPAKSAMFDSDLEELAAELPNDYIPGPKLRIAMTLFQAVMSYDVKAQPSREFSNSEKEEESEPSKKPKQ